MTKNVAAKTWVLNSYSSRVYSSNIDPNAVTGASQLSQNEITYLGSFQLPSQSAFDYGGGGMSVNGSTLYLSGNTANITLGRVQIPDNFSGNVASIISNPVNVPGDPGGTTKFQTGTLVYNNRLISLKAAAHDQLDGLATGSIIQAGSLSIDSFTSLTPVSSNYTYYNGFMAHIPNEWRALFGGGALIGNGLMRVPNTSTNGPACGVFDPDSVDGETTVQITPLLNYPVATPLSDPSVANNLFSRADNYMAGMIFPSGYRSVVFIGRHGYGDPTYNIDDGGCGGINGEGAAPYRLQAWAYDANHLLAVKNGTMQPHEVQPYSWWDMTPPSLGNCVRTLMGGCTYDPTTRRIYVTTQNGFPSTMRIHVWEVV